MTPILLLACVAPLISAYVQLPVRAHEPHALTKRLAEHIINDWPFYLVEMKVGFAKEPVQLWFDTRSSQLWFSNGNCEDYYDYKKLAKRYDTSCDSHGVFDPQILRTFVDSGQNALFSTPGGLITANGYWGTDQIRMGNLTTNMTFGVATLADNFGVFGLGFVQSKLSPYSSQDSIYTPFGDQLVKDGTISRNTFSFSVGPNNSSDGLLLFGAVDHGKYNGTLQKVKMVSPYADETDITEVLIVLDGISGYKFEQKLRLPAILETSRRSTLLPKKVAKKLAKKVGAKQVKKTGVYTIGCNKINLTDLISFYFSGIEIQVPVRDMVYESNKCYWTVAGDDGPVLIGNDVLASAYVVVDMDRKEVALAQAAGGDTQENIEDIVDDIPLALQAPLYSFTGLKEQYLSSDYEWSTSKLHTETVPTYSTNTESRSVDFYGTVYEMDGFYYGTSGATRSVVSRMVMAVLTFLLL